MGWVIRLYCLYMMSHVIDSQFLDDFPDHCDCHDLAPAVAVSYNTVRVRFNAEKTGNESSPWNLTVTATWQPPVKNGYVVYSVAFELTITPEDLKNEDHGRLLLRDSSCPTFEKCSQIPRFNTIVDEPTVTFGDLLFGYSYRLIIHTGINCTYSKKVFCTPFWIPPSEPLLVLPEYTYRMNSPDCLATTGDLEYCKQQPPPPLASIPRNVEVRINYTNSVLDIVWEEPYYVDGNVTNYQVLARKFDTGRWSDNPESLRVPADIFHHNFTLTTKDIESDNYQIPMGFIYEIRVSAVVKPVWFDPGFRALLGGSFYMVIDLREERRDGTKDPSTSQPRDPAAMEEPESEEFPVMPYIILAVVAVLVVVSGVLLLVVYRFSKGKRQPKFEKRVSTHTVTPKHKVEPAIEFRDKEILHLFDVALGEAIGSGQFGEVYKARWQHKKGKRLRKYSEPRPEPTITVAVKTTKENLNPAKKEEFLDEIRLMIEIGEHDNILSVLGCRTIEEPYYLITEFMKYGSLKDFLIKSREPEVVMKHPIYDLTDFKKLQISHQITKGMEYLSETRYFHGDLAARNILIGEGLSVKISDFGLSNDIYGTGYIRLPPENKRPVKWYSPEANLDGKCSTEGDVWSFGVVLYEIYSHGTEPYLDMQPREVITRVTAGYRMEKPEECPDEVYGLMRDCWQSEPEKRPTFSDLKESLEDMLKKTRPESYFEPEHDESYHIESEGKTETPVHTSGRGKPGP